MADEKTYSVLIVEDEHPAREKLADFVRARPGLRLGGSAKNGREALEACSTGQFDLLLLDINLGDLSGIEVVENLAEVPYVIFITAYDSYAVKAFDLGAIDYILKPYSEERFNRAIDRFVESCGAHSDLPERLTSLGFSFREEGTHYFIPFSDIIYFSSHGKHVVVHTDERDFETPLLLKNVESRVPGDSYARIHKQYIINIQFISHVKYYMGGHYTVFLKDRDETRLTVSRTYVPALKERLNL